MVENLWTRRRFLFVDPLLDGLGKELVTEASQEIRFTYWHNAFQCIHQRSKKTIHVRYQKFLLTSRDSFSLFSNQEFTGGNGNGLHLEKHGPTDCRPTTADRRPTVGRRSTDVRTTHRSTVDRWVLKYTWYENVCRNVAWLLCLQVQTYQKLLEPLLTRDEDGLVFMPELFYLPKKKVNFSYQYPASPLSP